MHLHTGRPRALLTRPSPFRKAGRIGSSPWRDSRSWIPPVFDRDLGLARARRLTVYTAVGATAFTGVLALVAATSFPGRTATAPAAQPGSTDNGGNTQPGLTAPIQQPQYAYGGAPVAISGGS